MYDDIPSVANNDSLGLQFHVFGVSGSLASSNDDAVGILQNRPKITEDASLRHFGRSRARVGRGVSSGDKLTVTDSGWMIPVNSGGSSCAKSLGSVDSGGIVDVICNFASAYRYLIAAPSSNSAVSGEFNASEFYHAVNPTSDSVSTDFALRSTVSYQSSHDLLSGGYLSAFGSVVKIEGAGSIDKAVCTESQLQITDASSVGSFLFFEAVPSIVHSNSNVTQAVGYYMANASGVQNIENIQSLRFMQCDQAGAASLINGPIFGEYGYSMSGAGAALAPAPGIGYAANRYYTPYGASGTVQADTVLTPFVYAIPFYITDSCSPNRMGMNIESSISGSVVMGVYNAYAGQPQTLLAQATGTIDCTSVDAQELTISSLSLKPGMHIASVQASANISCTFTSIAASSQIFGTATPYLNVNSAQNAIYMSTAYTGTLPASYTVSGLTSTNNRLPAVWLRTV